MAKQINESLQRLAKRLNLTGPDDEGEEYILTKEEEEKAIAHEIKLAQEHYAWRVKGILMTKDEIDLKISQINWLERLDQDLILKRANSAKHYERWIIEQRVKEKLNEEKRIKELQEAWTAENLYKLMAWTSQNEYGKRLLVKDPKTGNDFSKLITALCFFVSRDKRFETLDPKHPYSLDKALIIRGISGLGKTHLVKCIAKNGLNPILILSMLDISEQIRLHGEVNISLDGYSIIYLDDVGTEEASAKHYGNVINFFKNFIEGTYLRRKSFNHIIMSTNNSFSELEQKYGFRVRSRLKDMANVIDVSGKDMRGNG